MAQRQSMHGVGTRLLARQLRTRTNTRPAGSNKKGQLGLLDTVFRPVPVAIATLRHQNVAQVTAGEWNSAAVTASGKLMVWGEAECGVLGLGDVDGFIPTSRQVKSIPEPVVTVAIGRKYMVALDKKGDVYSWGRNAVGQLGLGDTQERRSPCLVEALSGRGITGIACGPQTTVAWNSSPTFFSWGWLRPGRHPDESEACPNPYPVVLPEGIVKKVACGTSAFVLLGPDGGGNATTVQRAGSDEPAAKPRTPFRLDSVEERIDSVEQMTVSLSDEQHNVRTFPVRSKKINVREFLSSLATKLKMNETTLELHEYWTSLDSIDKEETRMLGLEEVILELEESWLMSPEKSFGLLVRSKDLLHPVSFVEALRSTPYFAVRPSARGARDRRRYLSALTIHTHSLVHTYTFSPPLSLYTYSLSLSLSHSLALESVLAGRRCTRHPSVLAPSHCHSQSLS